MITVRRMVSVPLTTEDFDIFFDEREEALTILVSMHAGDRCDAAFMSHRCQMREDEREKVTKKKR